MSSFLNYNSKIEQKKILYRKYLQNIAKHNNSLITKNEIDKKNLIVANDNLDKSTIINDKHSLIDVIENKKKDIIIADINLDKSTIINDNKHSLIDISENEKINVYLLNYSNNYYKKLKKNIFITDNISINIKSKNSIPIRPEFPLISNNNTNYSCFNNDVVIFLFIVCYNESFILPHLLKHYYYVTKIFIYDNCSCDNSIDIVLKDSRCEIFYYSSKFCDETNQYIKNNCWKQYREKCDYCIVCDADEFLYHSDNVYDILLLAKKNNQFYSYLDIIGINMVSLDTKFIENDFLYKQINKGYIDKNYSKNIIFCPFLIKEINYSPGSHTFKPESYSNKFLIGPKCILLHFKYIGGIERLKSRQLDYSKRLSKKNIQNNQGLHYLNINSIENEYLKAINRSVKIL